MLSIILEHHYNSRAVQHAQTVSSKPFSFTCWGTKGHPVPGRSESAVSSSDMLYVGVELGSDGVAGVTGDNSVVVAVAGGAFGAHGEVFTRVDFPRASMAVSYGDVGKVGVEFSGDTVASVTGLDLEIIIKSKKKLNCKFRKT